MEQMWVPVTVVMGGIELLKFTIGKLARNGNSNGKMDTNRLERIERKVDGIADAVTNVRERVARLEG